MIESLRSYRKMTSSGADWLPALPAHWELHRAKASFREVDERSLMGDEELLSVSHKTGVTPRSQKNVTMFMAETYEGHKTCQPGDIVVNTMWAWMAALGTSKHVGIVSPAYGVYRQRNDEAFDPRYLDYLLRTEVYRGEYLRSSRGITTSRLRLYPPDFLNIPFIQPPLGEQRLIVRFLDWHGAMTGRLIRAKRRLIALLNEQKQSIIHRAVTRGLNPAAKLKPSGVDWLGDVPEHWETKRLKWLARNIVLPADGCADDEIYVALEDVEGWTGKLLREGRETFDGGQVNRFRPDDVLFGKLRPYLAKVHRAVRPGVCVGEFLVIRPNTAEIAPEFLELRLRAMDFISNVNSSTFGARMPRANWDFIGSTAMAYPVRIEEQRAIVTRVADETGDLEAAISASEREIALIQEFRTRLIADVVTGQLDVRAMAANLPDVAEAEAVGGLADEDDLVDDAENLIDEEEAA